MLYRGVTAGFLATYFDGRIQGRVKTASMQYRDGLIVSQGVSNLFTTTGLYAPLGPVGTLALK